jgi:hypothetical protein
VAKEFAEHLAAGLPDESLEDAATWRVGSIVGEGEFAYIATLADRRNSNVMAATARSPLTRDNVAPKWGNILAREFGEGEDGQALGKGHV